MTLPKLDTAEAVLEWASEAQAGFGSRYTKPELREPVAKHIAENERLRQALERRVRLLVDMQPLDDKAEATKWHRANELAQLHAAMQLPPPAELRQGDGSH